MPYEAPRPCTMPGCGTLTHQGRCERHRTQRHKDYDAKRGKTAARGYGARWQRYAKWFLRQPENIFCACGCGRLSEQVDHKQPVSGPDDPLFWEPTNHQGLTASCHSRKTATEDGGFGNQPGQQPRLKGCDAEGWSLDPRRPFHSKAGDRPR